MKFSYFETLGKTSIIPARENQFLQEIIFKTAPVRRIAIAMNTNNTSTESYTESPFWCQQVFFRRYRIRLGGQSIVDFDTANNCCLYFTRMKAKNFQGGIPSIPIYNARFLIHVMS